MLISFWWVKMEALSKLGDMAQQDLPTHLSSHTKSIDRPVMTWGVSRGGVPENFLPILPSLTQINSRPFTTRRYSIFERFFDIAISFLSILIFLPFLIFAALAIKLSTPGPILFIQSRIGRNGKPFPCLKFRTMVTNSSDVLLDLLAQSAEARAEWERDQKLRNDPRITPLGAVLRKSSLDELPQLFNILFGHMSIVGPRPIIEQEITRYGNRFSAYCSVRPGLTGLWQVSGRNEISYDIRVRLDARYALRKSTLYDMGICFRTIPAVIASRGVY